MLWRAALVALVLAAPVRAADEPVHIPGTLTPQGFVGDDGTVYRMVPDERGRRLIDERKLLGRPLRIEARRAPEDGRLEVLRYALRRGDEWVGFDYCRFCGFEEGDNGGLDLCAGCAKRAGTVAPAPETAAAAPPPEVRCEKARATVRLATPDTARRAGLETATVTARPLSYRVHASAAVALDERRVARLASRVAGVVREAAKMAGDEVAAGETLAVIESAELSDAKAALRQAAALVLLREKTTAMDRALAEQKIASARRVLDAEAELEEARIERERARRRLRALGLSADEAARVEAGEGGDGPATLPVVAPFAGTLLERSAALGEVVDTSRTLFTVADLSRLLVAIDVLERDLPHVRAGARVLFGADALPGEIFEGKLLTRGAALDPETRTIRALAEVENAPRAGRPRPLAPGMFGRAEIVAREGEQALVVPRDAVQWEGCHNVVFVEKGGGVYETRAVELGIDAGGFHEVRAGVAAGERVVTTGSYLLKTEILKGSIGAGCCD